MSLSTNLLDLPFLLAAVLEGIMRISWTWDSSCFCIILIRYDAVLFGLDHGGEVEIADEPVDDDAEHGALDALAVVPAAAIQDLYFLALVVGHDLPICSQRLPPCGL